MSVENEVQFHFNRFTRGKATYQLRRKGGLLRVQRYWEILLRRDENKEFKSKEDDCCVAFKHFFLKIVADSDARRRIKRVRQSRSAREKC